MIKIKIDNCTQNTKQFTFPGGEVGVEIQNWPTADKVSSLQIEAHITNSDDLIGLLLVKDAVDRQYLNAQVELKLLYVPYARQDRVCNEGESLSISVFAKLINSCGFSRVIIADPHSSVTTALINKLEVISQVKVFSGIKLSWSNTIIVAPDQGATKKCEEFAKYVGAKSVITAMKYRDMKTGKILGLELNSVVKPYSEYFVLDDICDGGRTFTELAKKFEGVEDIKLELAVTHGIFSKGVNVLTSIYHHVYTTNSFHGSVSDELKNDKITWINL